MNNALLLLLLLPFGGGIAFRAFFALCDLLPSAPFAAFALDEGATTRQKDNATTTMELLGE